MSRYLGRRLLQFIPTAFGILTVLFILTYLMPSDPLRAVLGEQYRRLPPEVVEGIREELGLNQPFLSQYLGYVGRLLRFDLGRSYILEQKVIDIIGYRLPHTFQLMLGGLLVGGVIGIGSGIAASLRPGRWLDHLLTGLALVGASIPVFWLALVLQLVLTQDKYGAALFPVAGYESGSIRHLALPSLVLGLNLASGLSRVSRAAMIEARSRDYNLMARMKGLRSRAIIQRHQLRNALIPILTVLSLDMGYLLGGSVVTETIFNWPGLGRALIPAIDRRDTPVIMGILIFGAVLFMLINLVVDVLYGIIDPRIRLEK